MVLGTYKNSVSARATDKQIQKVAQDGGIVTALLTYALEEKIIEGAVVAAHGEEMWKPEPLIAMTTEEIISAAGTKYTFSPNVWALKEAVRRFGIEKVGTVAIPCQINGIRKMQSYPFGTRFLADKLALIVGIFCMENFPKASLETFINEKMNSSTEITEKMDIGMGKFWVHALGEELDLPLKETHGYEQAGCNICPDYTAELADVSTGSVGSPSGWSTVLTRTETGDSLFAQAVEAGVIETKDIGSVKPGLGLLEKLSTSKKEKAEKESNDRRELGLPVPF